MKPSKTDLTKEVVMVLLAVISVSLLVYEISAALSPSQTRLFVQLDLLIAFVFFTDFIYGLVKANNKKIFWKERWWEIFTFIPLSDPTVQAFRSLRVLRVLRIIRVVARLKRVGDMAFDGPSFKLFSLSLTVTSIIFAGSVAFHSVEHGVNPEVHNLFDSFWWAMVTVTTIGYGDIYPYTAEGRLIAMLLMITGIGSLGIAATTIANSVTTGKEKFTKK